MDKPISKSDSNPKSSESRDNKHESSKRSSNRRPTDSDTRKFAVLSNEFIKIMADSVGISDLSEDILGGLAEDASYKLREVVHNSSIMLKNSKRRRLTTEDVNRVFQASNVPPIYGYISAEKEAEYTHIPNADIYIENDKEVDIVEIAFKTLELVQVKDQFVKGIWAVVEPIESSADVKDTKVKEVISISKPGTSSENSPAQPQPTVAQQQQTTNAHQAPATFNQSNTPVSTASTNTVRHKPDDNQNTAARPSPHLLNYYLQVAKIIVSGSTPLLQIALDDLRTNPNISQVCPFFLNLVALSVNKLKRDGWLTDALLSTVKALVENRFVDPSCYLAANRAANSLLVIAVETKIANNCDDLLLRSRAAELFSKILHIWSIEMKQQMDIVRQLLQSLLDKNINLHAQFGAIVCLIALGYRILFMYFWPVMEHYFPLLEEKSRVCSAADTAHVKGAIMMAAELMYRKEWNACTPEELKRRLKIDHMVCEYFGDSIVPFRQQYTNLSKIDMKSVKKPLLNPPTLYDFDFDYQSWNPSYLIQRRPPMQNTNPYVIKKTRVAVNVAAVFDNCSKIKRDFIFNYKGSIQMDRAELNRRNKGKNLYPQYVPSKNSVHKLSSLWYKQNIYKNTRTIKCYNKLHKKSCSGNLMCTL